VTRGLRYDLDWQEAITLTDGTRVRLRLLRPSDKDELARGLARLSPQSQYLRFFTTKARFTDAELRYLTELDGWSHLAIGAIEVDDEGVEGDGVGVARFVRLPEDPTVAEPAVAVVDARQGQGLGTILVRRLMDAAVERGIERFRSEFLAMNAPMREVFESISSQTTFRSEGPIVRAEFPLVPKTQREQPPRVLETTSPGTGSSIFDWLRFVAERTVALRQRWLNPETLRETLGQLRNGGGSSASTKRDTNGDEEEAPEGDD
jgi:GNAT superfamily N-acetyltransferase